MRLKFGVRNAECSLPDNLDELPAKPLFDSLAEAMQSLFQAIFPVCSVYYDSFHLAGYFQGFCLCRFEISPGTRRIQDETGFIREDAVKPSNHCSILP